MATATGKVYLVGAGPGEPSLITVRGLELLCMADVVFYDYLVDPVVLDRAGLFDRHTPPELVCLGRHGEGRLMSQGEINQQMVAAATGGKMVVRLKGGDPAIFGRTGEEISALEAAGIPYEVVPGVTSALAASSYAGIPLTHRDVASCVAFVTGQECREKVSSSLDLARLAQFPGTLVFYMGVTTAPSWTAELLAHGKPPETPVAVVRRATFADQHVYRSTLGELGEWMATTRLRPPAIIIVGEVVATAADLGWFMPSSKDADKPLLGKTILVTRPQHQTADMLRRLHRLGAGTAVQPAIELSEPDQWDAVDDVIARLAEFRWLVFSSANGVEYFLNRLKATGRDLRSIGHCKLAAIGPATAGALARFHLRADLLPQEYRAEALADTLVRLTSGGPVLLLRASRGREVLAQTLLDAGIDVAQVVVYESHDVEHPSSRVVQLLRDGKIDWITVTSSAIARSLVRMFGADLRQARLAAISPLTADVLEELDYPATVIADDYTAEGLIRAIIEAH